MARAAYIEALLGSLEPPIRRSFRAVFDYLLTSLRIGRVSTANVRAENMQWYVLTGTTPSTPNEEFSLPHSLGRAPYLLLPVLPLDAIGGEYVRLAVPRAADAHRVYLTSPEVDAPITVLIEG